MGGSRGLGLGTGYGMIGADSVTSADEARAIEAYFQEYLLEDFLVNMLIEIGKVTPRDPFSFMVSYITSTTKDGRVLKQGPYSGQQPDWNKQRLSADISGESSVIQSFVKEWAPTEEVEPSQSSGTSLGKVKYSGSKSQSLRATLFKGHKRHDTSVVEQLTDWNLDVLAKSDEELVTSAFTITESWGLVDDLTISPQRLQGFMASVMEHYNANHYHNFKHGYDVMKATGNIVRSAFRPHFTSVEVLAELLAALSHDVGHEGYNNDFYVKTHHDLAIRYNDQAVLESMHAALSFELMRLEGNTFHDVFSTEDYQSFRRIIIQAILSTDMKVHFDLTQRLVDLAPDADGKFEEVKGSRELVQKAAVHAADISNPLLTRELYQKWTYVCVLEFYEQAEKEKSMSLPFAPHMEHHPDKTLELAKLQIGFISFVVQPFWKSVSNLAPSSLGPRVEQLASNLEYWKEVKQELDQDAA